MTFRKNSLLFCETEIFAAIMAILCLLLIPAIGVVIPFVNALLFITLALVMPKLQSEFITINDVGISCQRSGKQCWSYEWNNIAELRRSTQFRRPSVEVITYDKTGKPEQYALPNQYFQLSKSAKDALKQYYKKGR